MSCRYKSPAMRRYVQRLLLLMVIYLIILFVTVYMFRHNMVPDGWRIPLAVLPAFPVIGVFWAVMRLLIEEKDEYMRLMLTRQCLVATGFCLTIMTVWEFLQNFHVIGPGNFGFGAAMWWFMGLGVGELYNRIFHGSGYGA